MSSRPTGSWQAPARRNLRLHFRRGCFDAQLARVRSGEAHVDLLIEHDFSRRVASTRDGSLVLGANDVGLMFFAHSPDAIHEATRVPNWFMSFCGTAGPDDMAERPLSDGSRLQVNWSYALVEISLVADPLFRETWTRALYEN